MPPERPRLLLVTGNDAPGIEAAARKAVAAFAGPNPPAEALEPFREREGRTVAEVILDAAAALQSPPFLGAAKTVWLHLDGGFPDEAGERGEKAAAGTAMQRLAAALRAGLPPGVAAVLSGAQDKKKPLQLLPAAVAAAGGRLESCNRPEFNSRDWRAQMARLIVARAREKQLELPADGVDYLVDCLGTDTGLLDGELEKVACYLGKPGRATLADLQAVCQGTGEATDWSLLDAVRRRQFAGVWEELSARLAQEKRPEDVVLRLLGLLHREFSAQLQLLVFAQSRRLPGPAAIPGAVRALSPEQRAAAIREGFTFLEMPPFAIQKTAAAIGPYKGAELTRIIPLLRDAWWAVVSGQNDDKRLILESLLLRLAGGWPLATG
ncbi:MAG: hypothetical protein WC789_04960 [Lentisphaeria bacterium]